MSAAPNTDVSRRRVQLDAAALVKVRASQVLAVDARVFQTGVELAASKPRPLEPDANGIGVVRIEGPLAQRAYSESLCGYVDGYDAITARVSAALADHRVDALVLVIDSPGGDAHGLEEAIARMTEARTSSGKPVFAYVDELAASAAYWIASTVATHVTVPTAGGVGSIGCISAVVDATKQLEAEGLQVTLIRDPEGKAAGHPAGPVTELAIERDTAVVRAFSSRFATAVAKARGLKAKDVRGLNADVLHGDAAVEAGLANEVGTLEGTIRAAAKAARQARKNRMEAKLQAAFGLSENATDAEIQQAADERALGATIKARTGASTADGALETVTGWQTSHVSVEQDRAELERQRKADEASERVKLYAEQITLGYRWPSTTWALDGDSVPIVGTLQAHLAATPIEAARAETASYRKQPRLGGGDKKEAGPAAFNSHGLDERELALCAETKCPPEVFARLKHQRENGGLRLVK